MDTADQRGVQASLVADEPNWLLHLPETALDLVLQKLDPCSLASTAASCRKLSLTVPATLSKAVVQYGDPETLESFQLWAERHNTSLINLSKCHVSYPLIDGVRDVDLSGLYDDPPVLSTVIYNLPRPQLRQLVVRGTKVQLAPAGDCPGVLHGCIGLTALQLQDCNVQDDSAAASAAVAACTGLQHLNLIMAYGRHGMPVFEQLPFPQLTTLHVHFTPEQASSSGHAQLLTQLSALGNLQNLAVGSVEELPDGVPTQLTKLTALSVLYASDCTLPGQVQHLSSLAALQAFRVQGYQQDLSTQLSGIGHLAHLTVLSLGAYKGTFSTTSIQGWACRTTLQVLSLSGSPVQPEALASLTQLRELGLAGGATLGQLLEAVSFLPHLTRLRVCQRDYVTAELDPTSFTALTASTNLCALKLGWCKGGPTQECAMFRPNTVYPQLRVINLAHDHGVKLLEGMLCEA